MVEELSERDINFVTLYVDNKMPPEQRRAFERELADRPELDSAVREQLGTTEALFEALDTRVRLRVSNTDKPPSGPSR